MTDSAQSEVATPAALPVSISARLGLLQFHLSGKFRVLQFADVQDVPNVSSDTIRLIESACDAVRPDIVVFTGNQIAGYEKVFAKTFRRRRWQESTELSQSDRQQLLEKVRSGIARLVNPLEKRRIPWVVTYGNHDFQCGLSNAELDALYQEFPCCMNRSAQVARSGNTAQSGDVAQSGNVAKSISAMQSTKCVLPHQLIFPCEPGTFALPVRDEKQENVVFSIVLLDSGDYSQAGGYGKPSREALDFVADLPTFLPPRLCVFQHFPLPQYYRLLREVPQECAARQRAIEGYRTFAGHYYTLDNQRVLPDGYLGEGVSCPDEDVGEFDILAQSGAFVVVAGHDHRNAFAGREPEHNMLLISTPTCGFGSYGPEPSKRGVRLLEFDIRHPFEPRTQMLEFGEIVGKPSSKKAYTYGLTAESEHDLPEVNLLRKPSLFARLLRRWRNRSAR